jgi:mono/diheme cytochrome c family protein
MNQQHNMKLIAITLILCFVALGNQAQQNPAWLVPDEDAARLSTFKFDEEVVARGKQHYERNCAVCHGTPCQGDYVVLVPSPGDVCSKEAQANTDGMLFYKLANGLGAMPSFRNVLSETEIWEVVAYVRSYNPNYAQEIARQIAEGTFDADDLKILLEFLEATQQVKATVSGIRGQETVFVPNAEINLFARRAFGNLVIDGPKRTNEDGVALFAMSNALPGDTAGMVSFFAKLPNESLYGIVEAEAELLAGVPTFPVSYREKRAMWNTMDKAPIWLLVIFFGLVAGAWAFIFLIIKNVLKIAQIGKEDKKK